MHHNTDHGPWHSPALSYTSAHGIAARLVEPDKGLAARLASVSVYRRKVKTQFYILTGHQPFPGWVPGFYGKIVFFQGPELELELRLIQTQIAQKPL